MRRIALAIFLSSLIVGTVVPSSLQAQTREEIRQAHAIFQEGRDHYDAGEFEEAAAKFEQAYELAKSPQLLFNIGLAYRMGGELEKAEEYLQLYLAEMPDAPNVDEVLEQIIEIQQEIAARMASVTIRTSVAGMEASITGGGLSESCTTPCSISVPSGDYELAVEGPGYQADTRELVLESAERLSLEISMQRRVVPGRLVVYSDRVGGKLRVGTDIDEVLPLRGPMRLLPGDYPVEIEASRNVRWRGTVRIEPDETTSVMVPMQPLIDADRRASPFKAIAYGLWGVSAAVMLGGLMMGIQTRNMHAYLSGLRDQNGFVDAGAIERGQSQQTATNVLFGIGALSVASGIGIFLWDEWRRDDAAASGPATIKPSSDFQEEEEERPRPSEVDLL